MTALTNGVRTIGYKMTEPNINVSITDLFAIPVGIFDLKDHPLLSTAKDLALQESQTEFAEEHLLMKSGKSSWGKGKCILRAPELATLKKDIDDCVDYYRTHLGLAELTLINSWFNVMPKGSYVLPHRHERSIISGALYVDAGDESANLFFTNPTSIYRMTEKPKFNESLYTARVVDVKVSTGRCVLFPSWLEHGTDENHYDNRIVISFNYKDVEYNS